MDLTISPRIEDFRARIARFVALEILPVEADPAAHDAHGNIRDDRLDPLRRSAVVPASQARGWRALSRAGMAVC